MPPIKGLTPLDSTRFAPKICLCGTLPHDEKGKATRKEARSCPSHFPVFSPVRRHASSEPRARGQARPSRILGIGPLGGPRQTRTPQTARCAPRRSRRRCAGGAALARPRRRGARTGAVIDDREPVPGLTASGYLIIASVRHRCSRSRWHEQIDSSSARISTTGRNYGHC